MLFLCAIYDNDYFVDFSLSEDEAKEVFKSLRQAAGIFMQAKVILYYYIFLFL